MQPELYLKSPVGITCFRGFMLVAETYRLNIALRLHAIQMVRSLPLALHCSTASCRMTVLADLPSMHILL